MAGIVSVSRIDISGRRKRLRQKRHLKIIQAIWRTLAISGLLGGLLWIALLPYWVLTDDRDIVVSGNQTVSTSTIQSQLVLSYPQSLWRIEPNRLAKSLLQQPTIAQASVTRRLFPPALIVQVTERVFVAQAIASQEQPDPVRGKKVSLGLLDASGFWIPIEKYRSKNNSVRLPDLKIIGAPEQYRPYWAQLYQAVSLSSVKVMEIDCSDPTNVILKTELGLVHIGSISSHLPEQIRVMAQMRNLPTQLNPTLIEYIDLKNPDAPLVQVNQKEK